MPGMRREPGGFTAVSAGAGGGAGAGIGAGAGAGSAGFNEGNKAAGAVSNLPISPSKPEFSGGFAGAAGSLACGAAGCGVCARAVETRIVDDMMASSTAARRLSFDQARDADTGGERNDDIGALYGVRNIPPSVPSVASRKLKTGGMRR